MNRRIAIALPARSEAVHIVACLRRLIDVPADPREASRRIVVFCKASSAAEESSTHDGLYRVASGR